MDTQFYREVISSGRHLWLKNVKRYTSHGFTVKYKALKKKKVSQCSPLNVKNGNLTCSDDTCQLTCNMGYFSLRSTVLTCVEGNQWAGVFPKCLSVKIVGTTKNQSMGRVEVFVDGQWYAVSYSRGWTIQSANIVCRMLGLPNATAAPEGSIFPSTTRYTLMQVERCTGHETSIFDCSVRLLSNANNYGQGYAAGVICGYVRAKVEVKATSPNKMQPIGEVLLSVNGVRAPLGVNNWDKNAMDVVCRMMGIEGPHDAPPLTMLLEDSENGVWVDHVKCLGNESSLLDCDHPGLRNKNQYSLFGSYEKALVACGQMNLTLQLSRGVNEQDGIIQAYFNGIEGGTDFQTFSSADLLVNGNVACRMLGLPTPAYHIGGIRSGNFPGNWELVLSQVRCQGNEKFLLDCNYTITSASFHSFYFLSVKRQILICSEGRLVML
ncbi:deleted in malignant brain tumors 1 protein-like [Actinia tenebrosa]|uniref:Deleted in malignant brain tumors 1 protein-like n=1 Tax=Actinia tenebrosa TaxID=6105 RepID=A0A6P8IW59_ACTTE|nr:deleted in malignant brain tumors 1 protein-like [Actinia tenebrosa]